ncbi:hypothetical protein, partial [Streptomyces sp. NPDC059134]|uniref:hypothetical protein n=1 Tax=Streptomyces sp. NPDC059134 TaxID=3346738 RepID=UPI003696AFE7
MTATTDNRPDLRFRTDVTATTDNRPDLRFRTDGRTCADVAPTRCGRGATKSAGPVRLIPH